MHFSVIIFNFPPWIRVLGYTSDSTVSLIARFLSPFPVVSSTSCSAGIMLLPNILPAPPPGVSGPLPPPPGHWVSPSVSYMHGLSTVLKGTVAR